MLPSFYPLLSMLNQTINPKHYILCRNGTLVMTFDDVPLTVNQVGYHLKMFKSYVEPNRKDLVVHQSHVFDNYSGYYGFFEKISAVCLLHIQEFKVCLSLDQLKTQVGNQFITNLSKDIESLEIIFDSSVNKMEDFEPAMYLFVNNDLGMGKGKIAGQVAHCACQMVEKLVKNPISPYLDWSENLHKKVVLKATENQLQQLKLLPGASTVNDAGRTQIPSNSLTVVGFPPTYKCQVPQEFNAYKLL
jgi:peptidyl-tRNA hydrolase